MNEHTSSENLPAVIGDDGFDDSGFDDRLIKGTILRAVDVIGSARHSSALQSALIALSSTEALQRWENQKPAETVVKQGGQPLPDVDALNAKVPKKRWEAGLDGNPRPPWVKQHIVYLLDPRDASLFTYLNSTAGARIAVRELKDKVAMMRKLRGANVVPLVELGGKPMKTGFGTKMRPYFHIADWRDLGGSQTAVPAIEHVGNSVKTVTTEEFLNDELPDFDDAA
jgi:hypothetical protein